MLKCRVEYGESKKRQKFRSMKEVKMEDYVLLLSGFEQSSHGKTLNRVIKPNYEVEKVGNVNVSDIWDEYNEELNDEK